MWIWHLQIKTSSCQNIPLKIQLALAGNTKDNVYELVDKPPNHQETPHVQSILEKRRPVPKKSNWTSIMTNLFNIAYVFACSVFFFL